MLWIVLGLLVGAPPDDEDTAERVKKLVKELQGKKPEAASAAAYELGNIGPAAKEAIPALREALKSKSVELRGLAAAALLLIDQAEAARALPVIREGLKDQREASLHFQLMAMLGGKLKPSTREVVQGLLEMAGEDNPFGWIIADMALGRVEKGNKQVLPVLEAALKSDALKSRVMAARFLGRVVPSRVKDVIPILHEGLKLPDIDLRLLVATDLLEMDPEQAKVVIDTLTPALKDRDLAIRRRVAVFLLVVDAKQAEQSLPVLREALKNPIVADVVATLQAIGQALGKKADRAKVVQPLFEEAVQAADTRVRVEGLRQLGSLGPLAQTAEKAIRDASKDRRVDVAAAAVEAQMRVRPEKAGDRYALLVELAEKRDRAARGTRDLLELVEKLKQLSLPGKEEEWAGSLTDEIDRRGKHDRDGWHREELLRLNAVIELGDLGRKGKRGVNSLANVLKERGAAHEVVRGQAAIALGRIGKEAAGAIPTLLKVSKDETEPLDIRAAAREGLRMIDADSNK